MLRFTSAIIAMTAAAAPAIAQTEPPAIAFTGSAAGDVATAVRRQIRGFAERRGLGLADLATRPPPRSRARPLLAAGIEAYHAFKYADALASLEACAAAVGATGGAELDRRELADLFLYRALAATETGAAEVARDNLVAAATIHPTYAIDKARFRPSLVAAFERALDSVRAVAAAEVALELPDGCKIRIDGSDTSGVTSLGLRPGRHFIRALCPGREPFAASPTFAAGPQQFKPSLAPRVGDRQRALASTAPAPRLMWVDLAADGAVSIALIDRAGDKTLRRWTVAVGDPAAAPRLEAVMSSILDREFAAPAPEPVVIERPSPPRRWHQKPWVWVAVGAVAAGVIATPILLLRSGEPGSWVGVVDFGDRR